jgi:hypothetical protein
MYSLNKIDEFKLGKKTVFMVQNTPAGKGNFLYSTEDVEIWPRLPHHFLYILLVLLCFINGEVFVIPISISLIE